ncbi:MAG: TetR/AcrR family transcriptional regulator [Maricaulis sp.]|nr:TetR/AcrR family transcriptional regulator [Maricaulis sp.]
MTKTPSHRRRPEARSGEILDAALAVFSEEGFSAAKMDTVAKRAGLSKGAVYLYFKSKDAILEALIERSVGDMARNADRVVEQFAAVDPVETYRNLLRAMFTAISDPAINAAPRIVFAEAGRNAKLARYYRENVINIGESAIWKLIEAGVARGAFRSIGRETAMRCIAGPAIAQLMLTTVFALPDDPQLDPAQLADDISDVVLNGLLIRDTSPRESLS